MNFVFRRNEKRRFDSTGEPSTWLYYHEVDELLGSNQDNTMDSTTLDESKLLFIIIHRYVYQ